LDTPPYLITSDLKYELQLSPVLSFSNRLLSFSLLCQNILHFFFEASNLCSFLMSRDQISHPYSKTGEIIVLCILSFDFFKIEYIKTKYNLLIGSENFPNLICS